MVIFIMLSFSLQVSLELLCDSRSARPGLWSFHLVSFSFQVSQVYRVNISISEAFSAGYLPIYGSFYTHFIILSSVSQSLESPCVSRSAPPKDHGSFHPCLILFSDVAGLSLLHLNIKYQLIS